MWTKLRIDALVVAAAITPVFGTIAAIHTSEPAWLLLCFALALFL